MQAEAANAARARPTVAVNAALTARKPSDWRPRPAPEGELRLLPSSYNIVAGLQGGDYEVALGGVAHLDHQLKLGRLHRGRGE